MKKSEQISYIITKSWLGHVLIAQSAKGICAIHIGDFAEALPIALQRQFPRTILVEDKAMKKLAADIVKLIKNPRSKVNLKLDIRGTEFQKRVWDAVRKIPYGNTLSYADIARKINAGRAMRAVGTACGANNLAIVIPCHRVVRSDGSVSGYAWGKARRQKLLDLEARAAA